MKPISIRFRCFGPYVYEQFIDFTKLAATGLFLICGETGAGKTTILDAMCYALYNQSSGGSRAKNFETMRCKQAPQADPTVVEFVFSCGEKRYKFRRSMEFKRKNFQSDHQCWEEREGQFVPLLENPTADRVSALAQTIIGLDYDQFRQVIVLPQGKFENFLVARSSEKEEILVTLFHVGHWQKAADALAAKIKEQDAELRQQRQQFTQKLSEYGCQTTEELALQLEALHETLAELQTQTTQAAEQVSTLLSEKEQAVLADEAFRRLHRQQRHLDTLLGQTDTFEGLEQTLHAAAAAQQLRPQYDQYRQLRLARNKAESLQAQCQIAREKTRNALDAVQTRQDKQTAARAAYEANTRQYTLLESKLPVYRTLELQKQNAQAAVSAYEQQLSLLRRDEKALAAAHQAWLDSQDRQSEATAVYQQAVRLYRQCMGSDLAQSLTPGLPCPVCGSTEHPAPARPTDRHITWDQLEAYNQAAQAAGKQVSLAAKRRQQAETQKNQTLELAHKAQQQALAQQNAYDLALEQCTDGIETLSELEARLRSLKRTISAFETEDQQLQKDLQQAVSAQAAADSRLEDAAAALREAIEQEAAGSRRWQLALDTAGFTQADFDAACMEPAEQARQQERLTTYRSDLAHAQTAVLEQQKALAGQQEPDMDTITGKLKAAQTAAQELQNRLALEHDRANRMRQDHDSLVQKLEEYSQQRIRTDADLKFAERLQGNHGPSLQRYVLGVMLSSITAEANRLLKHVYGGRYQLFVCQEPGSRNQKSGLDLEILDHANGQRRSVKTLSGGEKFLVALGLAIGLSTVVQAQGGGIRLEAMFIDEGFGSLDRDAVCDALDILDGIRKGSGLVGIISHVEQLAESIPTKIEIRKGRTGSTCVVKC